MSQFMKNIERSIEDIKNNQASHIVDSNLQNKELSERLEKLERKVLWIYAWSAGAAGVVSLILYILFNVWGKFI